MLSIAQMYSILREARGTFLLREKASLCSLVTQGCCLKVARVTCGSLAQTQQDTFFMLMYLFLLILKQCIFIIDHTHDLSSQTEQKHFHYIVFNHTPLTPPLPSYTLKAQDDFKLAIPLLQPPEY